MPSIIGNEEFPSIIKNNYSIKVQKSEELQHQRDSTPKRRRFRSEMAQDSPISTPLKPCSPMKWKSPRRCINDCPNSDASRICEESCNKLVRSPKSLTKGLSDDFLQKSKWNPKDSEQMFAVKEVLHVSTAPSEIVCREEEQKRIVEFCKACIEQEKSGSLYVCGCPGTGKTLTMEKVKLLLVEWLKEILEKYFPQKKINGTLSPFQYLQKLFSQRQSSSEKMMLIIVDELDYLITKDQSVLHDLFMLTTLPFSRCILIGIANAIDLADRFLPKLQSLSCKPMVITFRAYSIDQILSILQQRLLALPYDVFQPQALELCARKVAAVSGDMRKALCICRSAIEILEADLRDSSSNLNLLQVNEASPGKPMASMAEFLMKLENNIVRVDHMVIALSRAFKSAVVDTIQSLPQHQQLDIAEVLLHDPDQRYYSYSFVGKVFDYLSMFLKNLLELPKIILCSVVKLFRRGKKDTTIGELNKCYSDICKSALIPPAGILEVSNMCRVLSDQGLLKLGQSREDRLKKATLRVDEADIAFALQGIRFFRNCLQ